MRALRSLAWPSTSTASNVATILFLFFLAGREPGLEARAKSERTTTTQPRLRHPMAVEGGDGPMARRRTPLSSLMAALAAATTTPAASATVMRDLLFFPLQLDELPSTREPSPKERDTLP